MKILAIHVRRYRSLKNAALRRCGSLNVLIGKNNAGKSNLLSAIELMHSHLASGNIAGRWNTPRPLDQFTERDASQAVQIGVEYTLSPELNDQLRLSLHSAAPHLDRAIDQLRAYESIAFVLAGARRAGQSFVYIQQLTAGIIKEGSDNIATEGVKLLEVSEDAAYELFMAQEEVTGLRTDLAALEHASRSASRLSYYFDSRERPRHVPFDRLLEIEVRPPLQRRLEGLFASANSTEEFRTLVAAAISDMKEKSDSVAQRETTNTLGAFAGDTRTAPEYVALVAQAVGSEPLLHLRETKEPIGRPEAEALLNLKVTRGGPERLLAVQRVVRSLLGVEIDAFQADSAPRVPVRVAEMDIDQFLAEANGAGIREALRLILDLELRRPSLVLVEEPEVHLHPGLEHAMYSYLRDKSEEMQLFVTTHSTNFVDSVSFQNIYLVSRSNNQTTECSTLDQGDGPVRVPAELGLRLSTVFMYDRLVFVEGPSDEAVLRELAKTAEIDLAKSNVGFVHMGGVANFAHYAAEATLSLLSRRGIRLWFVADRDERDDADVKAMLAKLGSRATLRVYERRELENYLLDAAAVHAFISEKREASRLTGEAPTVEQVREALAESSQCLKDEVIRLRTERRVLRPLHLQRRGMDGAAEQRLRDGIAELQARLEGLLEVVASTESSVEDQWAARASAIAPGSLILDECCRKCGVKFQKASGDSAKLARHITKGALPEELRCLIRDIAQQS